MIHFHFSFLLSNYWDSDESGQIQLVEDSQGLEMIMALEKHYFEYFLTVLGRWISFGEIETRLKIVVLKWIEKNKPKLEGDDSEKCFEELWRCVKL